MQIEWLQCKSYAGAKDYSGVLYLHEWDDAPFYWGKAHKSHFGGHKRLIGGLEASGRYNSGYRHWIEGCLRHGAKLYIGLPDEEALAIMDEIENFLIFSYKPTMSQRVHAPRRQLSITHIGSVPASSAKRSED